MADWMQWPSGTYQENLFGSFGTSKPSIILINLIENHFEQAYGYSCILFPSARNALFQLMNSLKLNRQNHIYIPPYSPPCLYETFGRRINVSTTVSNQDVALINHKWGLRHRTNFRNGNTVLIEDSSDSMITDASSLFPNSGDYQLQSLPKIYGVASGGILIFRNARDPLIAKLRDDRISNARSRQQFRLKRKYYRSGMRNASHWQYYEFDNKGLARIELINIYNSIQRHAEIAEALRKRRAILGEILNKPINNSNYLGPVSILKFNKNIPLNHRIPNSPQGYYHYDVRLTNGELYPFESVIPVAIHSGISDTDFSLTIQAITNLKSMIGELELLSSS